MMLLLDKVEISISAKEVEKIVRLHLQNVEGVLTNKMEFVIEPKTDDRGNYAGQEFVGVKGEGVRK
jgi:hypothetical protein